MTDALDAAIEEAQCLIDLQAKIIEEMSKQDNSPIRSAKCTAGIS